MRSPALLLLALLSFAPATFGQTIVAGRSSGQANVSSTGEATYTIPIAAPPGVRGLTPSLALSYSHRNSESIAGYGWNISGYSAVTRCESTYAQDNTSRNVRNDLSDRFCLNGNKLRLVAGTYGVAGSEYRTEIETYSRIKAYGSAGTGPAYFIAEGKDGLIYEYGNTASSRIESKGQTTARAWALNKIRDRDNNEINFTYFEDVTNGSYRLDLVSYAGNSQQGTTAIYSIDLVYEAKPTGEVDSEYRAGSQIKETQRVDRVDVLVSPSTTYRRYELTYEPALSVTKRSRLASVQECAGATMECLAPTTFTYANAPSQDPEVNTGTAVTVTNVKPMDVNGDGREDLVYPNGTGPWMVVFANSSGGYDSPINTGQPSTGNAGAIPMDYNADGKWDLLVPYSGGTWWVLLGSTSGLGAPQNTGAAATTTGVGVNARALDIDGDGQQDLVWADLYGYVGGDVIRWRRKIPGGAFEATATDLIAPQGADTMIQSGIFTGWDQAIAQRTPDFNGDGRGDIAYRHIRRINNQLVAPPEESSSTQSMAQRVGDSAALSAWQYTFRLKVVCPGVTNCFDNTAGLATDTYFGDFNGDGLSDLLDWDENGNWVYRFSTGTGFTSALSAGPLSAYGGGRLILDWDEDGFDDVLLVHTATSMWYVMRSTGETLLAPVTTGVSTVGNSTFVVTDMNGDRVPDLAYRGTGNTLRYGARPVTQANADFLTSATDGFGASATFVYAPITDPTIYTKGTGAVFPNVDTQKGIWVVKTLAATDGTGNDTTFTLNYTYESARNNVAGRGFVGFARRNVIDSRLGYNLKTVENYLQSFPYIGALASTELKQSSGTRIRLVTNTWDNLPWGTLYSTERRYPFIRTQVVDEHEVGGTLNGTKFRSTSTSVAATSGIDTTSGLILDSTITTTDVAGGTSKTERTINTLPFNDTANWCIGRPTDTEYRKSHTLPNGTQLSRFTDATWDGIKCRPTQERIEPDNATWRVTVDLLYDAFGNVNSQTVTGGGSPAMAPRQTLIGWGARGQFPHSITNPLGQVVSQTWNDVAARPDTMTDANGLVTSWGYDSFGRSALETRPDTTKTIWTYSLCPSGCDARVKYYVTEEQKTAANVLIRTRTQWFNRWDAVGWERVKLLDSDYAWTSVRNFDARGRVATQWVPYLSGQASEGTRRWTYDQLDRVVTDGLYTAGGTLERSTGLAYSGLSATVTDPLTHTTTQTMSAWGDLLAITDAASSVMSHQYNAFGELKQTTDAAGNVVVQVGYNQRGFRTSVNDINLGNWTFAPNALGEVASQTDAKAQTTSFTFDKLGRMLTRVEPDGTSTWTWGTDAGIDEIGHLKTVSGPGYLESLQYDTASRLKKRSITVDGSTHQFDLAYNSLGELDTLAYPTSTASTRFKLKYEYNNGYLTAIREFTGDVNNTTFWALNQLNARGQAIDEVFGNGLWVQSTFKPLTGQIETRKSGTGGAPANVQDLMYTWDTGNNLSQRQDLRQGGIIESFQYDSLDRLTQASGPGGTQTLSYNSIGNVTSRSDVGGGSTWTYHATKKNAVTAAGSGSYGYDANGNMTSRNGATLTWTSGNMPVTLTSGSLSAQFAYAPDRSRWRQIADYTGGAETTIYIGGLLEKLTTPVRTHWKHLIVTPSGQIQHLRRSDGTTETYYLPSDHLDSGDAVLNAAGTVLVRTSYAASGARRDDDWNGAPSAAEYQEIANSTRRGFTGHEMLDNIGLVHMNGRVYDPAIGRFLSADPFIDGFTNPQGWNRYSYVQNGLASYNDPSGFMKCADGKDRASCPGDPVAPSDQGHTQDGLEETTIHGDRDSLPAGNEISPDRVPAQPLGVHGDKGPDPGNCWNGEQGDTGDFLSGLARQVGNDLMWLGGFLGSMGTLSPEQHAANATQFGSNNTNVGILGRDFAPVAELSVPVARVGYVADTARISRIPGLSAPAAVTMRNALKVDYRLGAFSNSRMASYEALAASGLSDSEIIASAGRTNVGVNAASATVAASAASQRGCKGKK